MSKHLWDVIRGKQDSIWVDWISRIASETRLSGQLVRRRGRGVGESCLNSALCCSRIFSTVLGMG
ncbi:UNVERIFIED_CONTAM: hypothetical protein Slati_3081400 [Sesamum latifolium]|uniref:Uncharacterized protein n=1 Tax=Sesamum latifolium TaxID=2727402 RepID=A0AAW2UWG5_9LAMI